MMNKESIHNIRLGFFVVAGIILLVVGLYFIGSKKNLFGKTFILHSTFENVGGLQSGNNVRYSGIDIGTVDQIMLINDTTIGVRMTIDDGLKTIIRKNSMASVGTDGLMGNKLINIEPGTTTYSLIEEGDTLLSIHAVNTEQMLRTLQLTNDNMSLISINLKTITNNISRNRGTLYKVLLDTSLAERFYNTINNIEAVSVNLNDITTDVSGLTTDMKHGKGIVGTLMKDTVLATDLREAIGQMKEGGSQINSAASDLKIILNKINKGQGTASVLLNDTTTANQIKRSIINLEKSTKNFNENMEGLKQSFLLRGYFRRQAKQNEEKNK